jgi:hypothetical protein
MGMYDRVLSECPKCSEEVEFQSKSGRCLLEVYKLLETPAEVMDGVNGCSPVVCDKCGSFLAVVGIGETPYVVQVNRPVAGERGEVPYRKRSHRKSS